MQVLRDVSLQEFNSLRLPCIAAYYILINQTEDVAAALEYATEIKLPVLLLSGGSNMMLPERLDACVLHLNIAGIQLLSETDHHVLLNVGAGENWHDFVCYSTQQGYYGLQNLALIPGMVGASPVQNIGAYGVEVGEFIHLVEVYDREQQCQRFLKPDDCQFAYRDSIFKQQPQRYVICAVQFRLLKQPQLKINYGDLQQAMGAELTPENLQQQVIAIRQAKLPDPKHYPNAGSFFKNPVISTAQYELLKQTHPLMPHYPQGAHQVKVAAGWLIEQAGWKGKRMGPVGMFEKQALVLVNYAQANLSQVQQTYRAVQADVQQKFNILLEVEPVQFDQQAHIVAAGASGL